MGQMEHLLNVYAQRVAKGSIADFLGYCEVEEDDATSRLTEGLWLVSLDLIGIYHLDRPKFLKVMHSIDGVPIGNPNRYALFFYTALEV